ncbi:CHASE domain-containing protein [Roseateles amylovorans]|uniref:CHASE domain-containing protein n=1 Tax=Roseateles amylovorans TaxID=2978473 RepID=A0ABY6AUX8_9BURK|nr:CHASE domain-containing protein [Roseateles amylovorans]UXH76812.1 CHASE domain-containing protein [Roseateles amylovorans]
MPATPETVSPRAAQVRLDTSLTAFIGAALVLVVGLSVTLCGMLWNRNRVIAAAHLRLDAQMERLQRDIAQRFIQPVYGLKGARGTIAALHGNVDRAAFRSYVESRDLPNEFPGVRGFGFAPMVKRDQLEAFIAAQRADGAPQFNVRTSGQAPDLYVIAHVEPLSQNYPAWGFDLGSEAIRRRAIEQAIDTGDATLSAPVPLVQDRHHGPGFLTLVPVFRAGSDPVNIAQRRQALLGLLYAPLVAEEILSGLTESLAEPVDFRLVVDDGDGTEDLLLDSATGIQALNARPQARPGFAERMVAGERRLQIGGRAFRLEAAQSLVYEHTVIDAAGWGLGLTGSALTVLLAFTAWLLLAGRERAQALADAMTIDLQRLAMDQEAMLDNDLVGIAKLRHRHIVWKNRALDRIFGYGADELLGQPARLFYLDDEAYTQIGHTAYPTLSAGGHYRCQLQMRRKDGSQVWIDLNGVALPGGVNEDLSLWLMVDITQSKAYEQSVEQAAFHDPLTGLPNRILLGDRLQHALAAAQRQDHGVAVAYLDLDGFKKINDTHGHEAGDEVLKTVAQQLTEGIRASDTAARLGGDEFVLVLSPVSGRVESQAILERVLRRLMQPITLSSGTVVQVGSSIGVAHYPADASQADPLMSLADQAMYESKRGGRCRIRLLNGGAPPVIVDLRDRADESPGDAPHVQRAGSSTRA